MTKKLFAGMGPNFMHKGQFGAVRKSQKSQIQADLWAAVICVHEFDNVCTEYSTCVFWNVYFWKSVYEFLYQVVHIQILLYARSCVYFWD